jgi:hypothetical protein
MPNFVEHLEQYYRLLGPVFLSFVAIFIGLGYFILHMYELNLKNKVEDAFPAQIDIYIFFFSSLVAGIIMLAIILVQTIHKEKASNAKPAA